MKKWSYVTALMLAASTGCVFTGCIDNDEPNGIEQIRIATADLLKSKKALAEAQAAAANAEVEIAKIQAEIEKAKLENEKLQAAARAEIERLQAEAQAAKTKAEAERILAMAEAIRMEAQAKVDSINAETARYIAQTEDWIKKAELAREKAAAQWEIDKLKAQTEQLGPIYYAVAQYYDNYLAALDKLNSLNKKLIKTQTLYAQFENDLVWVPAELGWENGEVVVKKEGYWSSPAVNLKAKFEKAVSIAESDVADAEETVKEYEELLANLDKISEGELNQLLLSYEAGLDDAKKALVLANANLENIKIENSALYDQILALDEKIRNYDNEAIGIPEYTYVPNEAIAKSLPGFLQKDFPVVGKYVTYTLNGKQPYDEAVKSYKRAINGLTGAMLDDNDVAWTNARLAEIERELAATDTPYENAHALWTKAVAVYNNGAAPEAAAVKALPGEAKVEEAIAAFAAAGATIAEPRQKVIDAYKAYQAAVKAEEAALTAYIEKWGDEDGNQQTSMEYKYAQAQVTYDKTRETIEAKFEAAIAGPQADLTNAYVKAGQMRRDAQQAMYVAEAALYVAQDKLADATDANREELQTKYDEAETAYNNAYNYYYGFGDKTVDNDAWAVIDKAQTAFEVAQNAANEVAQKEIQAAQAVLNKAESDFYAAGGYNESEDPEFKPVADASKATEDAQDAFESAQTAFDKAVEKAGLTTLRDDVVTAVETQEKEIAKGITNAVGDKWSFGWPDLSNLGNSNMELTNYLDWTNEDATFPTIIAPAMCENSKKVYENAKNLLIMISGVAYGELGKDSDYDKADVIPDDAFLVNVTPEIVNEYIAKRFPNLPSYRYSKKYGLFGLYGDIMTLTSDKEIATASLQNPQIIPEMLKPLEENLKALKDGLNEANETKKDMQHDLDVLQEQESALTADANAEIGKAERMVGSYTDIVSILKNGVAQTELNKLYPNGQEPSGLEKAIEDANEALEGAQKALAAEQKVLEKAQYQLDRLMSGEAEYIVNPYTNDIESLKSEIAAQSDKVDYLKAALDALQAKYEALASK